MKQFRLYIHTSLSMLRVDLHQTSIITYLQFISLNVQCRWIGKNDEMIELSTSSTARKLSRCRLLLSSLVVNNSSVSFVAVNQSNSKSDRCDRREEIRNDIDQSQRWLHARTRIFLIFSLTRMMTSRFDLNRNGVKPLYTSSTEHRLSFLMLTMKKERI